jgi:hypothetical protein
MLHCRRDWRQATKSTVIIQIDFYEEEERQGKGFRNFFVQRALQCGNCRTILLTLN